MISVKKNFHTIPEKLKERRTLRKIMKTLHEGNGESINAIYNHEEVFSALSSLYKKKCAYCETNPQPGSKLQVEHYRPKKKVTEFTEKFLKNPDKKNQTRTQKVDNHKGYFWLGYEWSNLLLSCQNCNGPGAKGNLFPIEGNRVFSPQKSHKEFCPLSMSFLSEKPLLLHPEIDTPEDHIIFLPSGKAKGVTERGRMTILICDLNRENLILKRREIKESYQKRLRKNIKKYHDKKIGPETLRDNVLSIIEEVFEGISPSKTMSRFRFFLFLKFPIFIVDDAFKDSPQINEMLKKAFASFKKSLAKE